MTSAVARGSCSTKRAPGCSRAAIDTRYSRTCQPPFSLFQRLRCVTAAPFPTGRWPCGSGFAAACLSGSMAVRSAASRWLMAFIVAQLTPASSALQPTAASPSPAPTNSCARAKPSLCNLADDRRGMGVCQRLGAPRRHAGPPRPRRQQTWEDAVHEAAVCGAQI